MNFMTTTPYQSTTDYDMFKLLSGNRRLNRGHVNKLIASISRLNLLADNPIVVNSHYEIIDGQHRLKAAKELKTEIFYKINSQASLNEAQILNGARRNWNATDYLESFCTRGFKEYKILRDFVHKYDFSVSNSLYILTGGDWNSTKRRSVLLSFKAGEFVATHWETGEQFAKNCLEVEKYLSEHVKNDRDFLTALQRVLLKTKVSDLIQKFKLSGWKVEPAVGVKSYLRQFEDIVNYKKSKKLTRLY